jgi:hypothetical protein
MFVFFLGLLVGFLGCLYYLVMTRTAQEEKKSGSQLKGKSLYLNFHLLDKSAAVQAGVEEKLQDKLGRGFLRDKIANSVSKVAANKVSDETVGEKILEKIIQEIPLKVSELGITAEATKVYCRESVFILKL